MRPQGEDIAMTTTPPTLAQVLRDQHAYLTTDSCPAPWDEAMANAFLRMAECLERSAALEAPARDAGRADSQRIVENFERLIKPTEPPAVARDAGREGNRAPHYFQIGGLTGDMCDLCGNHRDSPWHLGVLNLDTPEASGTAREAPSRSSATGSASLTPTEPPPPAAPWDAEKFIREWIKSKPLLSTDDAKLFAQAAYTAGQRAAGVQVPEEMPAVLPDLMERYAPANSGIDPQAFWAALRTHLTQTREG
jgi:hypothetical protein